MAGGDCRSSRVVVVVKGIAQVTDVIGWCDADHTSLLMAGRISGTQSLRVLARSLRVMVQSLRGWNPSGESRWRPYLDLSPDQISLKC